jgi:hypothetical protein
VPRIHFFFLCIAMMLAFGVFAAAQQPGDNAAAAQPQVKVNMLNVCTPSAEEQKEMTLALARIPKQPLFSPDFEVSRGRSTLTDMPNFLPVDQRAQVSDEPSVASYVRIRREFSVQALFSSVQYSFSDDGHNMVETVVLHVRDPKDLIQVSLEDSASSVASAEAMLTANTPVRRIRLERFGKSSVALARCEAAEGGAPPDQSAYEPIFRSASEVLGNYRGLLDARKIVPEELDKVAGSAQPKSGAKTVPKSQMRRPVKVQK